jgi:hypothetical protein
MKNHPNGQSAEKFEENKENKDTERSPHPKGDIEKADAIGFFIGKRAKDYERQNRFGLQKRNHGKRSVRAAGRNRQRTFQPERKGPASHSSWKGEAGLPGT